MPNVRVVALLVLAAVCLGPPAPGQTPPGAGSRTTAAPARETADPPGFQRELRLAEAGPDRDSKVEHLFKALALRPEHRDNIVIEFRIGVLLSQTTDPDHHQGIRPREALPVYEALINRYEHMQYYEFEGPETINSPQQMVTRACIHAACLHMWLHRNGPRAREHLRKAMECLQMTYERRTREWREKYLNTPPPEFDEDDPLGGGAMERSKWESRVHRWNELKQAAEAGDVFSVHEMVYVKAAVRQYGYSFGPHKAHEVPAVMAEIIRDFPGTPMAQVAAEHAERAGKIALRQVGEEHLADLAPADEAVPEAIPGETGGTDAAAARPPAATDDGAGAVAQAQEESSGEGAWPTRETWLSVIAVLLVAAASAAILLRRRRRLARAA